jgi:hypothetical protein
MCRHEACPYTSDLQPEWPRLPPFKYHNIKDFLAASARKTGGNTVSKQQDFLPLKPDGVARNDAERVAGELMFARTPRVIAQMRPSHVAYATPERRQPKPHWLTHCRFTRPETGRHSLSQHTRVCSLPLSIELAAAHLPTARRGLGGTGVADWITTPEGSGHAGPQTTQDAPISFAGLLAPLRSVTSLLRRTTPSAED